MCCVATSTARRAGLVQIEAMRNGVPMTASPGVRQPVTMTGMGEVTQVGRRPGRGLRILRDDVIAAGRDHQRQLLARPNRGEYIRLFENLPVTLVAPSSHLPDRCALGDWTSDWGLEGIDRQQQLTTNNC
jgi:hypothetical protein